MKENHSNFLIVGEVLDGALSAGAKDLGKQARKMAAIFNADPMGVLLGHKGKNLAESWADLGSMPVIFFDDPDFSFPNPGLAASAIMPLISEKNPEIICFPHTLRSSQTAASLAASLKLPLVTAIESIQREGKSWICTRAVFDGRLKQKIRIEKGPFIASFMPGIFSKGEEAGRGEKTVEIRSLHDGDRRAIPLSIEKPEASDQRLEKAQVVVSAGRGLGSEERLPLLFAVAGMFKNSAVGGSRVACDMGWFSYSLQIGETGRSVSPALYLACGISGSPQHLAGIQEAQTVIAINKDKRAPMLNRAQYAVIEDLAVFLPVLRERYDELYNKGAKE